MKARGVENETVMGVGSWMISSVSMMILNKRAIDAFPHECTLTAMQMLFSVCVLLCGFRYIRIGSLKDVLRWCLVTPFFSGMLLTSMLALKNASMTLVIVFRCLSPLLSLPIEVLCYPRPLRLSATSFAALLGMVLGTCLYASQLTKDRLRGLQWVLLNMVLALGDRLLQRLMLAEDQEPVDLSKAAVTLINNLVGFAVVGTMALVHEASASSSLRKLSDDGMICVLLSCIVSICISYTGVWAQSLISATSFLMLVNANKFILIFAEVFLMQNRVVNQLQLVGALMTVFCSLLYGHSRCVEVRDQAQSLSKAQAKYDGTCP